MFPKDLGSLFSIDGQTVFLSCSVIQRLTPVLLPYTLDETAKTLMQEYNLPDISDSRERNVNRFMQFCGVSYQLVRKPHSS